jgi:hypothetical protein
MLRKEQSPSFWQDQDQPFHKDQSQPFYENQRQPFRKEQSQPFCKELSQHFQQEHSQSTPKGQGAQVQKEDIPLISQEQDLDNRQKPRLEQMRATTQSMNICERLPKIGMPDYFGLMLTSSDTKAKEETSCDELCDTKILLKVGGGYLSQAGEQNDADVTQERFRKSSSCSRQIHDQNDWAFSVGDPHDSPPRYSGPNQTDTALQKTNIANDSTHQNTAKLIWDYRDKNESSFVVGGTHGIPMIVGGTHDGPWNVGGHHDGPMNVGSTHDGPGNVGSTHDGPGNVGSTHDGPGNVGSTDDGPGNVGSTHDGPKNFGEVHDDIPGLCSWPGAGKDRRKHHSR